MENLFIQRAHQDLASSNSSTWPNSRNLIIGSKIDGAKLATQNFEQLLSRAGGSLETIKFACSESPLPPTTFILIAKYCPNIVSFEANCLDGVDLHTLTILSRGCKKITEFKVSDRRGALKDEHLMSVLFAPWSLRSLKLAGSSITRVCIRKLPQTLIHLDIRSCKYLTPRSLNKIRERCPRLKVLRTNFMFDQKKLDDVCEKWPLLEGLMITSASPPLDVTGFRYLKDLFLMSDEITSLNLFVCHLKHLWRLHLVVTGFVDEVVTFESELLYLRLETSIAMPNNVVQSLPFCSSIVIIEIFGTSIHAIVDQLLINCSSLQRIVAFDTIFEGSVLSTMLSEVANRRKGPRAIVDAQVFTT